jgi:hypothetical protein
MTPSINLFSVRGLKGRYQFTPGTLGRDIEAPQRAEGFAAPAGYAVLRVFDFGFMCNLIHAQHVHWTAGDAQAAAGAPVTVEFSNSHFFPPFLLFLLDSLSKSWQKKPDNLTDIVIAGCSFLWI